MNDLFDNSIKIMHYYQPVLYYCLSQKSLEKHLQRPDCIVRTSTNSELCAERSNDVIGQLLLIFGCVCLQTLPGAKC